MKISGITIKIISVACLFIACNNPVESQSTLDIYKGRIDTLNKNVYSYFYDAANSLYYETNQILQKEKKHSYLWPLCALIQAANEEEALYPSKDFLSPVMKAVNQYYSDIPPAPGYQAYVTKEEKDSRFYDDNQWIAIACLDAYNRTRTKRYLDIAEDIYRFMMTGFDTLSGGGLYWREDKKVKYETKFYLLNRNSLRFCITCFL